MSDVLKGKETEKYSLSQRHLGVFYVVLLFI